jgi:hypothetical protein
MPGAGDIQDPTKQRTHTIQGTVSSVATELQTWLQALSANTQVHTISTVRANNSQGLIVLIAYALP